MAGRRKTSPYPQRSHWNECIRDDAKIVLETLSMVSREGAFALGMNLAKDGRKARRDREKVSLATWEALATSVRERRGKK
jgi:hypothetical protein